MSALWLGLRCVQSIMYSGAGPSDSGLLWGCGAWIYGPRSPESPCSFGIKAESNLYTPSMLSPRCPENPNRRVHLWSSLWFLFGATLPDPEYVHGELNHKELQWRLYCRYFLNIGTIIIGTKSKQHKSLQIFGLGGWGSSGGHADPRQTSNPQVVHVPKQ